MNFFKRYKKICEAKGIDPCSQKAADLLGSTRATISLWHSKNTVPKGDTVRLIADVYGTSTDFLLGRTDDPTDWSHVDPYDMKTTYPRVAKTFLQLDDEDRTKVESFVHGLLLSEKYRIQK